MKASILLSCIFLLASALAQQAAPNAKTDLKEAHRIQVDETLQRYATAYARRNFQDLLTVWPSLANDKKEAAKIRHHLEDVTLSDEQMTLKPLEIESGAENAIVRVERTEQYIRIDRSSSIRHGDLNMGNMPVQDPGPSQEETKKQHKKTDTVWFKMHRADNIWTIISIGSQKP